MMEQTLDYTNENFDNNFRFKFLNANLIMSVW